MARLWIVYREGLQLVGHVAASVPLERSVSRLDIAPWRFFTKDTPKEVPAGQVRETSRRRVLLEVREEDRNDFCALDPGFFESPYSPEESLRRLSLS